MKAAGQKQRTAIKRCAQKNIEKGKLKSKSKDGKAKEKKQEIGDLKSTRSKLVTVKKSTDVCPICRIIIPLAAPDRTNLLVNNKIVPVYGDQLKNLLKQAGLSEPKLLKDKPFDIEKFLKEQALCLSGESILTAGPKWGVITNIAQRLDIKTNFI